MRLDMNTIQTIQISASTATADFDQCIFKNISWSMTSFHTHQEISATLDGKNPYTITILIDSLKWDLWHRQHIEIIQYD